MTGDWNKREERLLRSLNTPSKIQGFLDALPYRCEDGHLSARAALRDGQAHCFDGSLLAAAALKRCGLEPLLIDLCATRDDDHILCSFRWKGRWGAVAKSNFPGLRYREPVFRTARELVLSYFELYFNLEREKTLRSYSTPMPLPSCQRINWECDDRQGDVIVALLGRRKHHRLLLPGQERALRQLDERLYRSQLVGVAMKGAYGGRSN
ncbi:MAG: hypothetical protein RL518_335 [Pseudomonadota bacterium]|jgi:hypothetical protein